MLWWLKQSLKKTARGWANDFHKVCHILSGWARLFIKDMNLLQRDRMLS